MFLIVGLGNPGTEYEITRHNVGFMLVDRIAEAHKIRLSRRGKSLCGRGFIEGVEVALLKPLTFMNLSGEAVAEFISNQPVPTESIVAAYDDCDLPLGKIRLRKNGGSGGHRGVDSLIKHLYSRDFRRIRLGVGRPLHGDIVDYVLSPFSASETEALDQMLAKGADSLEVIIKEGIERAMNSFNAD